MNTNTIYLLTGAAGFLGINICTQLTEFAVYNLERNNTFDCSKARNELGFAPRPYAETLHDTAAWLKATGKIH